MGLELLESRVTPSTFHVNTLLDTVAVNMKTGQDAAGQISLRSAIEAANAKPNADTIILPAGTFTLTMGELDISSNLTIKGKGAGTTIINGNNLDRVFQISSGKVTISGVAIEHGNATKGEGGGILISGGKVTLSSVQVVDNVARGFGYSQGTDGRPGMEGLAGGSAFGGGIYNAAGSLTIVNSFIESNSAIGGHGETGGAGTDVAAGAASTGKSGQGTLGVTGGDGGDGGQAFGGGIYVAAGATLSISGTTIESNEAIGGQGGAGGGGALLPADAAAMTAPRPREAAATEMAPTAVMVETGASAWAGVCAMRAP